MQMLNDKWANFRANTMAFFKPEGVWNRQAIIAVLIGGFVGWLIITVTFGARVKRVLKKVPGIKLLFGTRSRVRHYRAAAQRRRGTKMMARYNAKKR